MNTMPTPVQTRTARTHPTLNTVATKGAPIGRRGDWQLDIRGRYIRPPGGERVQLTPRERDLLALLAQHPGRAVSRDQISATLMGREWLPGDRSIDVLVRRVRAKLDAVNGRHLIKTARHIGYALSQVRVLG